MALIDTARLVSLKRFPQVQACRRQQQFVAVALSVFDVLDTATVPQQLSQRRFAFDITACAADRHR
jgi:hypothetical protein